jgi:transposase
MISKEKRNLISAGHKRNMSVKEMSIVYEVADRTIRGLLAHEAETGSMSAKTIKGRPPELEEAGLLKLRKLIEEQPDITLEEMKEQRGLKMGISELCHIVKHTLGYNFKKKASVRARGICQKIR